jgi:hypothetical protein
MRAPIRGVSVHVLRGIMNTAAHERARVRAASLPLLDCDSMPAPLTKGVHLQGDCGLNINSTMMCFDPRIGRSKDGRK